jgi:integrase
VTKRLTESVYRHTRADEFTPLKFKEFQQSCITKGRSRRYINDLTADIKFIFKWAVSEEMVGVTAYQALLTVPGLRKGRSGAKDHPPRKPVSAKHVAATLPRLSRTVRAMVQFQSLTGVRSQSICHARPCQFDCSGKLWVWKPRHKMENAGIVLTVFIGKRAQKIIGPFLKGKSPDDYVFQPRNKKGNRSRRYRSFYEPGSYRMAIRRAAKAAGVPHWFPHQLRHSLGTAVREKHGLEAAQAVLGHVRIDATQLYAQKQMALAKKVAQSMG